MKILSRIHGPMCSTHKPHNLPYMQWSVWAENKYQSGERQVRCNVCGYWFWKEEL